MSQPAYSLHGVEQVYDSRTVLHIPQLDIPRGEIATIIGPNGSGKTTLLRLLALLHEPTRGSVSVHFDNKEVTAGQASIDERRRMAMVFQRPSMLNRSVRENVAYGLNLRGQSGGERIDAMLARLGLTHLAHKPAHTLSGGETQRTALARALVLRPDILLLDEPTANLDPASGVLIEEMIGETHRTSGTTIVLVTHNLFQARRLATRAMLLMDGAVIEEGTAGAVFDHPKDERTAKFVAGEMIF